jgi:hypothetical protein
LAVTAIALSIAFTLMAFAMGNQKKYWSYIVSAAAVGINTGVVAMWVA